MRVVCLVIALLASVLAVQSLSARQEESPKIPQEWDCFAEYYGDGSFCDCECGAEDPDCAAGTLPVANCPAAVFGANSVCVKDKCTQTATAGITSNPSSPQNCYPLTCFASAPTIVASCADEVAREGCVRSYCLNQTLPTISATCQPSLSPRSCYDLSCITNLNVSITGSPSVTLDQFPASCTSTLYGEPCIFQPCIDLKTFDVDTTCTPTNIDALGSAAFSVPCVKRNCLSCSQNSPLPIDSECVNIRGGCIYDFCIPEDCTNECTIAPQLLEADLLSQPCFPADCNNIEKCLTKTDPWCYQPSGDCYYEECLDTDCFAYPEDKNNCAKEKDDSENLPCIDPTIAKCAATCPDCFPYDNFGEEYKGSRVIVDSHLPSYVDIFTFRNPDEPFKAKEFVSFRVGVEQVPPYGFVPFVSFGRENITRSRANDIETKLVWPTLISYVDEEEDGYTGERPIDVYLNSVDPETGVILSVFNSTDKKPVLIYNVTVVGSGTVKTTLTCLFATSSTKYDGVKLNGENIKCNFAIFDFVHTDSAAVVAARVSVSRKNYDDFDFVSKKKKEFSYTSDVSDLVFSKNASADGVDIDVIVSEFRGDHQIINTTFDREDRLANFTYITFSAPGAKTIFYDPEMVGKLSKVNDGVIAGPVVGGAALIAGIAGLIAGLKKRQGGQKNEEKEEEEDKEEEKKEEKKNEKKKEPAEDEEIEMQPTRTTMSQQDQRRLEASYYANAEVTAEELDVRGSTRADKGEEDEE